MSEITTIQTESITRNGNTRYAVSNDEGRTFATAEAAAEHGRTVETHAAIWEAQDGLKAAYAKLRRVSNPTSIALAEIAVEQAEENLVDALEAKKDIRRAELAAMDRETLAKRLVRAKHYCFEATMGDYSMGSINAARTELELVSAEVIDRGWLEADLVTFSGRTGTWSTK